MGAYFSRTGLSASLFDVSTVRLKVVGLVAQNRDNRHIFRFRIHDDIVHINDGLGKCTTLRRYDERH